MWKKMGYILQLSCLTVVIFQIIPSEILPHMTYIMPFIVIIFRTKFRISKETSQSKETYLHSTRQISQRENYCSQSSRKAYFKSNSKLQKSVRDDSVSVREDGNQKKRKDFHLLKYWQNFCKCFLCCATLNKINILWIFTIQKLLFQNICAESFLYYRKENIAISKYKFGLAVSYSLAWPLWGERVLGAFCLCCITWFMDYM